jgi:hypothetical protein
MDSEPPGQGVVDLHGVEPKKENGNCAQYSKCFIFNDFPLLRDELFG